MGEQNLFKVNKFGPKHLTELVGTIQRELKNEARALNSAEMFKSYDEKYIQYLGYENFRDVIIKMYTEEGYIYRRVNKILRDGEYNSFGNVRYYYFSLLFSLQQTLSSIETNQLYRGMKLRPEQLNYYNGLKKDDMILIDEFLSTTYDEKVAREYAKTGEGSCLFQIDIPEETQLSISKIEDFSQFKHEKEVLLPSGSILIFNFFGAISPF